MFFDKYEESNQIKIAVDKICSECPVRRQCLAVGVSRQEWGVWGGIYLEKGKISKDMNSHKKQDEFFDLWLSLTMEVS